MTTDPRPSSLPFTPFNRALLTILQIYGLFALAALLLVPRLFLPAEDAVILFQYSRNLAQHGAISFLAGGPHVEGATDFAWMLLLAAGIRCGIPPFWFCAAANVVSLLGLAAVLLRLAKLRISPSRLLAIAGAAALLPQIFAAAAGFAVLPDALLLSLLVLLILEKRAIAASLVALLLCLFRPDGVVFAIPLLASLLLSEPQRAKCSAALLAFFIAPGALYFLWRWHYFGELFPLPFLVKTDAQRMFGLVVAHSVRSSLIFLALPLLSLVLARKGIWETPALKATAYRRNRWLVLALVVVPTAFYWVVRLDQNVGYRFFFYLPLAAGILLAVNWPALSPHPNLTITTTFLAWAVLLAMPLSRELRTFRDGQFEDVKSIAEQLGKMPQPGTLFVTEAGFLPYYSHWATYDAWGLNTPEFAHRFVQPTDVERIHPDLIVLHPDLAESCLVQPGWQSAYPNRTWPNATRNLVLGADSSSYELWLTSYGSEYYRQRRHWSYGEGDRECWFVRKDSPLYADMARILADHHGVSPSEAHRLEQEHGKTLK